MTTTISSAPARLLLRAAAAAALLAAGACAAADGAPSPVTTVTLAESGAGNPTVATDPARGAVYVAWVESRDGSTDVFLARIAAAGEPDGAPVRVNDRPGDASMHEAAPPQVAVGPGGEVYVAWEQSYPVEGRRFPASNLRFARSLDGGRSFEPAVTVNSDADGVPASHTFHNLAVGADGAVYLSWIDSRARDHVRVALAAGGQAGAGRGGHGGHGGHGAAGEPALPGSELWLAVSHDRGATFREVAVVDRDVCPCCRTGLATGSDGSVYLVWRKIFDGDVRDIAIARSGDGGVTWTEPSPVHRDGWVFPGCPHAGPTIAVGDDGAVHVAWYTGREGGQGTFYARSDDGGRTFSAPLGLLTGEWVPPSLARVATAGDAVWVAWDDRREDKDDRTVYLARVERGRLTTPAALAGTTPDLALAGSLRALAWRRGEAVQLRMGGD